MTEKRQKKYMSIRTRLFLQVGLIMLIAIAIILLLNNFLLPEIYTLNEKRGMVRVYKSIDGLSYEQADYTQSINAYERANNFSIDVYLNDGTPIYYGTNELFAAEGKITVSQHKEESDGSFFEILTNEQSSAQYIVYGAPLSMGGEIEIYSQKDTIDANAALAALITSATSIVALLVAGGFIYFYTGKFTKPLIKMSEVTKKMASLDFSQPCEVEGNDEIGMLSSSINEMSNSLDNALKDLSEKNKKLVDDIEKEKTLEKIRKDFISNVSHELKTPISIIRGYSEGATMMLDSGETQSAKDYCGIIVNETEKMNALVLQLLELSMYESGSVSVHSESFDICNMIEDYANDNEIKFRENGINFVNEIPQGCFGSGDTLKLGMVVNNYISNAVSHADGEKLIKVSCEDKGEAYRVSVYNTGEHISQDDIDKIWISFYRADKARSRSEGRFGLGLSIVSAIQKLHGQEYGVCNADGGVCFWFDIKKA